MNENINPNLIPYRVMLHEEPGDEFKIVFDCQAENDDHAVEQAENAYPGCEIMSYLPFDRLPVDFVIYSANESALGNGFWSNQDGWVELPQATRFTKDETTRLNLPVSTGQDAKWVLFDEANISYGNEIPHQQMENITPDFDVTVARSDAIKAEYLASGCQACDVNDAVKKLMTDCGALFSDDRAAWSFLMEEPHEDSEELDPFQLEVATCINSMLQDDAMGQVFVFVRENGKLNIAEFAADDIDLQNLAQYDMILFDGGNSAGDQWKHTFYPKLKQHFFIDENPLPSPQCEMDVSIDGGRSYVPAREGVRIVYKEVMIDGEDGRGEVHVNATCEGLIADIYTTRDTPLDHNIGTDSLLIEDIVSRLAGENA